ncbi:hypothetical protein WMY93_021788 [Mugilogobius chulae]|uniref:CDK5 regulatory subunit-associated protein 2/Myomegalin coiled coil domain-containing protein n=1 Tax=Mugilogobius chulae TaxID=88201 RepID=A0AAW0NNU1_9GOBI
MKDLCRICRARLVGNQCRWIFSPSAKNKLQVILSHVLGREVTRDGRGEFLCGKCVFQLEKVMNCDVDLSHIQDEYNMRIRKLQAEKDHLIQCMMHVYRKNNPDKDKDDGESNFKTQYEDAGRTNPKSQMRRCVSLDRIAGKSTGIKLGFGHEGSMRFSSLRGTRHRSQSMYLDLVHRKSPKSRYGFKGRSTSLLCLNKDFASETPSTVRQKAVKGLSGPNSGVGLGKTQSRLQSTNQPTVISDLIQLLCCITTHQISESSCLYPPPSCRPKDNTALQELAEEFDDEYTPVSVKKSELARVESLNKQLTEELTQARNANEILSKTIEDIKNETTVLTQKLDEKENALNSEKKNALKRDKTIQGLIQNLSEKETRSVISLYDLWAKIAELCHEIEDREEALSKAREAAHKAQLLKYQGVEEHQNLLMEKQTELAQLRKLQRALDRKEQELASLQQAKDQLEMELEDMQQQQKKGDKAINSALEQQYQETLNQTKQKLLAHEVTIQRLRSTLIDKEQQLQEYIKMIRDLEDSKSSEGVDGMLSMLRQRLKEKEKALEQALDEKFAAIEDKDNEIHMLQLALREKERDLERLNNLVSHNEETNNHLANRLKNLQRSKQEIEDNLSRSLREKDAIISQLQLSLDGKTKDLEESDEHHKYMMSQRTQEIDDLRKQLSDKQQHLNAVEKQCSARTQEALSETAELRRLLEDKDYLIMYAHLNSKLLQQTKDRDQYTNEIKQTEESAHVLELRHTIQIMQEKLDKKEAELCTKIEENDENLALPKKNIILKKELLQNNEALNKALKREAELKLLLNELEGRCESQTANIESLCATLKTKDEIINTVPSFKALQQEHEALNRALKAEQQLYSSLVRTVKEQDSAQRLHALQLELTAVQLLRQQLEESIKINEELRDDLEAEIHRVKLREGMDIIDPKELESMKNQLEDAQRWNVSLQARLGAIQNRGGGVGGANDDQTSYMSICVGEDQDDSLSHLTAQELREKVTELQDYVSKQHALNRDLQNKLTLTQDRESQTDYILEQNIGGDLLNNTGFKSTTDQTREQTRSDNYAKGDPCVVDMTTSSQFDDPCLKEKGDQTTHPKEQTSHESKEECVEASGSTVMTWDARIPKEMIKQNLTKLPSQSRLPVPVRRRTEATGAALEHQILDVAHGYDQHALSSDSLSSQSASSSLDPPVFDGNSEVRQAGRSTVPDVPPATQLDLLQQQCRDKEALISELYEKLAVLNELQSQLQEKERLNVQLTESLQARESTIAYLTACSLDNQNALDSNLSGSNATLQNKCTELEHALNEKEKYIFELTELLLEADKVLNSSTSPNFNNGGLDIKAALQRNACCKERIEMIYFQDHSSQTLSEQAIDSQMSDSQNRTMVVLMNCLNTTESAIASLTAHCTDTLERLKKAFFDREKLGEVTPFSIETSSADCSGSHQTGEQGPHHNLQVLYEVFSSLQQKVFELQASQKTSDVQRPSQNTKALPPNVQNQIETLHKELREKRKTCKSLEEKLATAQSIMSKTPSPGATQKALKQDEKGVQVDLQDLGYETSAKSENDREESSSTDLEVGFKPICSASSLPSLLKQEQTAFSSTENIYSASSTYPTSPVLSSAKASLKSLRRSSLSSDVVASTYEPSATREDDQRELNNEEKDTIGQIKGNGLRDKSSSLNMSSERRGSLGLSTSDLLQSRSGSTSPARLESLIQSQARELSQLRQEIKDSRRLGALQRQQLEDLGKAFSNLIQSAQLDNLMGEEVKKQLDRSIAIMDSLEGRLDRSQHCLEGESLLGREHGSKVSHRTVLFTPCRVKVVEFRQSSRLHSDILHLDRTSSSHSSHESKATQSRPHSTEWTVGGGGGVSEEGASDHRDTVSRLQGLHRENARLQEQLRSSEQLNTTLRSELDLHCTIMAQSGSQGESRPEARTEPRTTSPRGCPLTPDLLAEHLQEIRALRQRLEESIRNNDSLREQLEKKLAEVEKDPVRSHIFIQDRSQGQMNSESQDKQKEIDKLRETVARRTAKLEQSRKDCETLRQENTRVQERLEIVSQERTQLQESLISSKDQLHRLQREVKVQSQQLSDSHHLLQSLRVELQVYEKLKNQDPKSTADGQSAQRQEPASSSSSVDLAELMSEIKHLRLQLERSIQTNNALRQKLEEQINRGPNHSETININYLLSSPEETTRPQGRESSSPAQHRERARNTRDQRQESAVDGGSVSGSSVDSASGAPSRLVPGHRMWANRNGRHVLGLIEDYSALRKHISEGRKLSHSMDTDLQECVRLFKEQCSDKNHNKQSSRRTSQEQAEVQESMEGGTRQSKPTQNKIKKLVILLRWYIFLCTQLRFGKNLFVEQKPLRSLSSDINTMQHVLEEAGRLMKLLWRVSLPVSVTTADVGLNQQCSGVNSCCPSSLQDEQLRREICRLKNRVLQQEKMLSGAVKRLGTTNQLKEGMERVIIDQLSLTHGILKKARGNLEEIPANGL